MKKLLILLSLLIMSVLTPMAQADMMNGCFYVDNNVECHLIAQNGVITTNQLIAGRTYMLGDALAEMAVSNKTDFYFSSGVLIGASPSSVFSIDLYDVDVKNLNAEPSWADLGPHNLSMTFIKGEFAIIYPFKDNSSGFTGTTPFTAYEFSQGKYLVRVSDKSSVVYVADGEIKTHDAHKTNKSAKGNLAIAMPFNDPVSGVADKIITSVKPLEANETAAFSSPILSISQKTNDVKFAIINGKVVGIKNTK